MLQTTNRDFPFAEFAQAAGLSVHEQEVQKIGDEASAALLLLDATEKAWLDAVSQLSPTMASAAREVAPKFGDGRKAVWDATQASLAAWLLDTHGVKFDVPELLLTALAGRRKKCESTGGAPEGLLERWSGPKILRCFSGLCPDPHALSLDQFREAALNTSMLSRNPPAAKWTVRGLTSHTPSWFRSDIVSRSGDDHIERFLKWIVFLAHGGSHRCVVLPSIQGLGAYGTDFNRKDLYRRQTPPIPGLRWLRFTADLYLELALEPQLLERVVADVRAYELKKRRDEETRHYTLQ